MKRTDGGGGHGITVVHDDEGAAPLLHEPRRAARRRSEGILHREVRGQGTPRRETQSGRDSHGNFTVYSTRDCSPQRRNQKLVEEAPAPFLSEEIISTLEGILPPPVHHGRLHASLGTCEFMVTPNGKVYFLEVNPRLQVEHTVSEEVSGPDLVREQLNIAAGGGAHPRPLNCAGHSSELRITSEDPATNLTPRLRHLEKIQWPAGPGVRIDTGCGTGDTISPEVRFDDGQGHRHRPEPSRRRGPY